MRNGRVGGTDLSALDPADVDGRRALLAGAHEAEAGGTGAEPADGQHLEQHLDLADRLWRGEPPSLWAAAQRFLDADQDRHAVLHVLMDAIQAAGDNRGSLDAALRELGPEPDE